jgi:hypothetical protein
MLGMLEKTLRGNMIAGCLRIATQLDVFFGDALGRATHLHIRSIRFVGASQRIWAFSATTSTTTIGTVAATHALVLMIWSHRTSFFSKIIHDG